MTIYPIVILPSTYPQILTRYYGSNYTTKRTKSSNYFTLNLRLPFMGLLVIGIYRSNTILNHVNIIVNTIVINLIVTLNLSSTQTVYMCNDKKI